MDDTIKRQGDFTISCQHKLPKETRTEMNGQTKEVHVVIKQSSFIVMISNDNISLKDCLVECILVYDNDDTNEVHYINQKPITSSTQITNQHRITCEIKISVLSSQHEDMLFKILFRITNDQGKVVGEIYSYPIRVISKADSKKKINTKPPKQPNALKVENKQKGTNVLAKRSSSEEMNVNQFQQMNDMNSLNKMSNMNNINNMNNVINPLNNENNHLKDGKEMKDTKDFTQQMSMMQNQNVQQMKQMAEEIQIKTENVNDSVTPNQLGMRNNQVNNQNNGMNQINQMNNQVNNQMNSNYPMDQINQLDENKDDILEILQYQQSILRELTQQTHSNPLANPLLGMINAYKQLPQNQRIPQLLRIITTLSPQDNALISELVSFIIGINTSVQNDQQMMQFSNMQQNNGYQQNNTFNQPNQFQNLPNQNQNQQSYSPINYYGGNNENNFFQDNNLN